MKDHQIVALSARRVWDSRGCPTVEVDVQLAGGALGRGAAPAGASTGRREALDLRDGGAAFGGKGVATALARISDEIAPRIIGMDATDQGLVDDALTTLDGTPTFARLGGNACVATSLAVMQAAAAAHRQPLWRYLADRRGATPILPLPEVQIFGGGAHAGRRIDIQDFMIIVPGAATFDEAMSVTAAVYHAAGALMEERGLMAGVADEGGWWPAFDNNEQALETLVLAIERAGERPGERVVISLDIAASQLCRDGGYALSADGRILDRGELAGLLRGWVDRFPIVAIEDPFGEDDDAGFAALAAAAGDDIQLIGDDYLTTDTARVRQAAAAGTCNALLVKINQAGTLSRAFAAFDAARACGWRSIVSARSGETEDVAISHLAVGLAAGQLKVGSFARGERMAKWNECLRIEQALGAAATFAGGAPLANTWWGRRSSVAPAIPSTERSDR